MLSFFFYCNHNEQNKILQPQNHLMGNIEQLYSDICCWNFPWNYFDTAHFWIIKTYVSYFSYSVSGLHVCVPIRLLYKYWIAPIGGIILVIVICMSMYRNIFTWNYIVSPFSNNRLFTLKFVWHNYFHMFQTLLWKTHRIHNCIH